MINIFAKIGCIKCKVILHPDEQAVDALLVQNILKEQKAVVVFNRKLYIVNSDQIYDICEDTDE